MVILSSAKDWRTSCANGDVSRSTVGPTISSCWKSSSVLLLGSSFSWCPSCESLSSIPAVASTAPGAATLVAKPLQWANVSTEALELSKNFMPVLTWRKSPTLQLSSNLLLKTFVVWGGAAMLLLQTFAMWVDTIMLLLTSSGPKLQVFPQKLLL